MTVPGFTEIDLVAHSGESGDGEFLHSLNAVRGQTAVRRGLLLVTSDSSVALPFHDRN